MGRKRKADEVGTVREPVVEPTPSRTLGALDPDVLELCDNFHIDAYHTKKLNELLMARQGTFEADMLQLWSDLERARNPNGLLLTSLKKMEEGTFVGREVDPELAKMIKKYKLDQDADFRLCQVMAKHPVDKRKKYYEDLEGFLECSNKPSATAMMLLKKIRDGDPLGEPPRRRKGGDAPVDEKNRDRSRDRDRTRQRWEEDDRRGRDDRVSQRYEEDYRDRDRDSDRGRGNGYRDGGGRSDYRETQSRDRYRDHDDRDRHRDYDERGRH